MRGAIFQFDGEQLTVAQIHERVSAISKSTIREHLAAGRCTSAGMLTFDSSAAIRAGGRMASARAKVAGTEPSCFRRRRA